LAPKLVWLRLNPNPDEDDAHVVACSSAARRWSGVALAGMFGAQTAWTLGVVVSTGVAVVLKLENCDWSVRV
jgi:hypothetical protein